MEQTPTTASLDEMLSQFPLGMRHERSESSFRCCCGRPQCAFLEHNNVALEGLEKDLRSAAQIGQALLVRHESNMRQAEEERLRMSASIDKLETDKKELEASNAKIIEENRYLLDQLEDLNNTVSGTDTQIQALEATLQSTRQEIQRLTVLAGRASELEAQLSSVEIEQATLQAQFSSSEEEKRSAIQRWQRAERTVEHLQDQVDRIEREAREERERHVEVVGRMERQRAVEKELESAAGRLKGAAAISTLGRSQPGGTSVVSHFVKDILQDNANLQMGIVELREMLMSSNAEVESLREQMLLHHDGQFVDREATLNAELVKQAPVEPTSAVHVHHHYHAPEVIVHRKSRRKRVAIGSAHFTPSSGASTPRTTRIREWRAAPPSSAATILSQTSVSVPTMQMSCLPQRQSVQSNESGTSFAPSSIPSSPGSVFRSSEMFDHIDGAFDSSRPTSPDCSSLGSPVVLPKDRPRNAKPSLRSFSTPTPLHLKSFGPPNLSQNIHRSNIGDDLADITDTSISPLSNATIPEESEHDIYNFESPYLEDDPAINTPTTADINVPTSTTAFPPTASVPETLRPSLRRATSHDSLISISGMDIHTLRARPSQMFTGRGFTPLSPYANHSPTTPLCATSLISPTTAVARPALQRPSQGGSSSEYNRSLLSAHARSNGSADEKGGLGRLVGGWVWGRKDGAPVPSGGENKFKAMPVANVRDHKPKQPVSPFEGRPPGVNQSGPIKGFKVMRTPSEIEPRRVDTGVLREALDEG